jgi:uncharacterized protein
MRKLTTKIIILIITLVALITFLSGFIIDLQWFKEVGYVGVFLTSLKAKLIIFIPTLVIMLILVSIYARYLRNNYMKISGIIQEKTKITLQNKIILAIASFISLLIASTFTGTFWYRILEFYNAKSFDIKDPIFNLDVSFYIFKLPLIEALVGVLTTIVVLLIGVTIVFYSSFRIRDGISGVIDFRGIRGFTMIKDSPQVRFIAKQLAILGTILLILLSGIFYLRALNLVYSPRGVAFGASYTDVNVVLPAYKIIAVLCLVSSIMIAYSIIRKKVKWIVGTAVFIIVVIVAQTLVAGLVERFIVAPNARDKEMPYLTYNIDFTRKAFGLENIIETEFPVDNNLTQKDIKENKGTIENIRINEFSQALEVYNQIQAIRNYYRFNDIDIDRYTIDGKLRQVFIAARELDNSNREAKFQTWQNRHIFYTHGYGVVASYTNSVGTSGLPEFILKDIPSTGIFKLDRPQIYFGEINNDYVIVGAKSNEIDYPYGNENKENRYEGTAGIKLNMFNRLLFTINHGSLNFLLSQDITSESKILINRRIMDRITKIAPFLNYDSDPYLVMDNGKLYWVVDAYTVSSRYPFSERYGGVNYLRNSIKVVVDAYDGKVDFYIADETDQIANTIGSIYKGLFKNIGEMPEGIKSHLRYSEDVFMAQSTVYEKYHMNNPSVFYNSEDLWSVAKYKGTNEKDENVEPVYQVMRLPGEKEEKFVLTIPFTVARKENMVSWLAVKMEGSKPNLSLIRFPKEKAIYGPQQINSKINTDTAISQELTLWGQQGSGVVLGETNIIPIKNSLLYVKPLYLRSQSTKSLPELKRVIVAFGDKIVMEDNIQDALARLFNVEVETPQGPQEETPGQETPSTAQNGANLVKRASELFNKAQSAQKAGDWASYGQHLKELESVLTQLQQIVK